jgi:hypothetical protein
MAEYKSKYWSSCNRVRVYGVRPQKMTNQERAKYEKERRDKLTKDAHDYRLLSGWMSVMYPDSLACFLAFRKQLRDNNPNMKDLTRSAQFHMCIRKKTGTCCLGLC